MPVSQTETLTTAWISRLVLLLENIDMRFWVSVSMFLFFSGFIGVGWLVGWSFTSVFKKKCFVLDDKIVDFWRGLTNLHQ